MLLAVVVLLACILTALLLSAGAAAIAFVRVKASLRALVEAPADNELSPLATIARALAQDFARAIILQLKQQIAAPASHMARQENLMRQDLTEAAIQEESPSFGALLGLLPKNVQKRVLGNPAAAAALIGLMGKLGGGGGAGASSNGQERSSVQMRLRNMQ